MMTPAECDEWTARLKSREAACEEWKRRAIETRDEWKTRAFAAMSLNIILALLLSAVLFWR